jgi:hypothetical protein
VQVQIISASSTILAPPGAQGENHNIYWTQAKAYNDTLSPTGQSEWLVCDPCTHGFPYEEAGYLAAQLNHLYERV